MSYDDAAFFVRSGGEVTGGNCAVLSYIRTYPAYPRGRSGSHNFHLDSHCVCVVVDNTLPNCPRQKVESPFRSERAHLLLPEEGSYGGGRIALKLGSARRSGRSWLWRAARRGSLAPGLRGATGLLTSQVGLLFFYSVNVRFVMVLTDAENQGETCILAVGDVIGVRLTDAVVRVGYVLGASGT